jgi:hypothetical protein
MKWSFALALAPLCVACPPTEPTAEQAATGAETRTPQTGKASRPAGSPRDPAVQEGKAQDRGDDGHANEEGHHHHHGDDGHATEHEHHHGDDGHANEHEHHHGDDGHANEHAHPRGDEVPGAGADPHRRSSE